mmetsp:Transcript_18014/g.34384  ORF Transcript_18014/g.34384 Transcript_18014/m.34384 type:complete len:296 (+) Transcript_18014:1248-2135(+)
MLHQNGLLGHIGFDTTNVARVGLTQVRHKRSQLSLVLAPNRGTDQVGFLALGRSPTAPAAASRGLRGVFFDLLVDDFVIGLVHEFFQVSWEKILVAGNKAYGIVHDLSSIVVNTKRLSVSLVDDQARGILVLRKGLLYKVHIATLGTDTFFVQHSKQTGTSFNEVKHVRVIIILDFGQSNTFGFVLQLHGTEHILCKLLLELFIGVVDTKLIETIANKGFETENIKETNDTKVSLGSVLVIVFCACGGIDLLDDPQENLSVHFLGEGVTGFLGVAFGQGDLIGFGLGLHGTFSER